MQTIELVIKDEEDGVFAISLVESPAIRENFVALSEQDEGNKFQMNLKTIDEERRIVVGYALIPNIDIPRRQEVNGEMKEFNITFSEQTVSKAAELYMKNLNLANVTSEHEKPVEGCCVIESWITEDEKHDKINLFDVKPIKGGWAVMMKLTPEEHAKSKDGVYNGFSIEAMFDGFEQLNSLQLPTVKLNSDQDKLEQIKNIING